MARTLVLLLFSMKQGKALLQVSPSSVRISERAPGAVSAVCVAGRLAAVSFSSM